MSKDNTEMKAKTREGKEASVLGPALFQLYGLTSRGSIRSLIRRLALKAEGGEFYSLTIRRIFSTYHNRSVGLYSGGAAFEENSFFPEPPGVTIGRYTSLARTMCAFNQDHPVAWKSTHALFYHPAFGVVNKNLMTYTKLTIGNDVWIGHNATLLSTVSSVGDGAVIAAGSVVFKDVPPYAVVGGNPARVLRYRFDDDTISKLLESKWWEKSIDELRPSLAEFQRPFAAEHTPEREPAALLRTA